MKIFNKTNILYLVDYYQDTQILGLINSEEEKDANQDKVVIILAL